MTGMMLFDSFPSGLVVTYLYTDKHAVREKGQVSVPIWRPAPFVSCSRMSYTAGEVLPDTACRQRARHRGTRGIFDMHSTRDLILERQCTQH